MKAESPQPLAAKLEAAAAATPTSTEALALLLLLLLLLLVLRQRVRAKGNCSGDDFGDGPYDTGPCRCMEVAPGGSNRGSGGDGVCGRVVGASGSATAGGIKGGEGTDGG